MTSTKPARRATTVDAQMASQRRHQALRWGAGVITMVGVIAVLYGIYSHSTGSPDRTGRTGADRYQVGTPGGGQQAPDFSLVSSGGEQISLQDYRGKTVLLYFQEGLTCQPCWDQLTALEKDSADVKAAGVDQVLSITTDPADLIARKVEDMGLSTPVLSDPDLAVSEDYDANRYGMMGASRDGHTFVLVGPDGTIRWRADYGGAPRYTMYVDPQQLLADLGSGERRQS